LFDFSSENVYKISKIVNGHIHKITPTYFSKICAGTGLLLFLLKDSIEFAGISIIDKRTPIQRIYNNYCYNLDIYNSKIYKLNNDLSRFSAHL